jgi:hypothetical protein
MIEKGTFGCGGDTILAPDSGMLEVAEGYRK